MVTTVAVDSGLEAERNAGMRALEQGNPGRAAQHLSVATSGKPEDTTAWVALAMAYKALGNLPEMHRATDGALASDPRNFVALIMKGDCLVAENRRRLASTYYGVAVKAGERDASLPPALAPLLARAKQSLDGINASMFEHLRGSLAAKGYEPARSSARFSTSLDILAGRKRPYHQEPRAYFFPDLPQIQFFPRNGFPWIAAIEAATDQIRRECEQLVSKSESGTFVPYIQRPEAGPFNPDAPLLDSPDWTACFLWKDGQPVAANAQSCPVTLAALESAPLFRIPGRSPSILFSRLRPGGHIGAHTGFLNTRLICHLPLIIPEGCGLRVGNEVRPWVSGEALIFDDSIEHEAWNRGGEDRIVLIFDVWRPDLSAEERLLVTELLAALDTFEQDSRLSWTQ